MSEMSFLECYLSGYFSVFLANVFSRSFPPFHIHAWIIIYSYSTPIILADNLGEFFSPILQTFFFTMLSQLPFNNFEFGEGELGKFWQRQHNKCGNWKWKMSCFLWTTYCKFKYKYLVMEEKRERWWWSKRSLSSSIPFGFPPKIFCDF
jgi:hypothetical protein